MRRVASGVTDPALPSLRQRRARAFGLVALGLMLLVPVTWALEAALTARAGGERAARAAQARTVAAVQSRATALVATIQREAEAIAALPEVQNALASPEASLGDSASGVAVAALLSRALPPFVSVEVYAPGLELVAWNGDTFQLGVRAVPDTLLSLAVPDRAARRALTVWAPVTVGDSARGAVRVVRLAQAAVPVRNRYLQDYDIADEWRDGIDSPFEVLVSGRTAPPRPEAQPLAGIAGRTVGWVRVPVPTAAALTDGVQARFRDAMAFWVVLLLGWLVTGLGRLYADTLARAATHDTGPHAARLWRQSVLALAGFCLALVGTRYALLHLDVPVRWLGNGRETPPLFDPLILASDLGWGLVRSPGDLALTALFAVVIAGATLAYALRIAAASGETWADRDARGATGFVGVMRVGIASAMGAAALGSVARSAVLDAPQLGYADRTGPIIDGLLTLAMGSVVAVGAAALCGIAAVVLLSRDDARSWHVAQAILGVLTAAFAAGLVTGSNIAAASGVTLALAGVGLGTVLAGRQERWGWPLTFRGLLLGVFVLAPIAYGFMAGPLGERTDALLSDAARSFAGGRDERVTYALDQVLAEARADDALRPALLDAVAVADSLRLRGTRVAPGPLAPEAVLDTSDVALASLDSTRQSLGDLAAGLVQSSLLGSLADVAAELRFISPTGDTLGGYAEGGAPPAPEADPLAFATMRERYRERDESGFFVDSAPSPDRRGLPRYAGIGPLAETSGQITGEEPRAWIYVRATPRPARFAAETPFPRVLAPANLFGLDDEAVAYAEYDDGVRARGGDEAPFRLPESIYDALENGAGAALLNEEADGETVRAYYVRVGSGTRDVVSARLAGGDPLDVLLVLLRLTLAGLAVASLLYASGIPVRRRMGLLPAPRTRFRDKVLNRFLFVGLASVALTGLVGQRVIEEQNQQAVRDLLRQRLGRVEAALSADAESGTPTGSLLNRARPDAISASLGFDVHLYGEADLLASSRRQLVNQRLIEPRLPAEVYDELYVQNRPFAFAESRIGTGDGGFAYTTGYKALPDSLGFPIGAAAVPTLPEQAAIEAGQARMVTYLFGGLLVLLVAIVAGAALLAGQLTRPFGRLQQGLRAVGEGRSEEPIPVETRDEVGELVETFNAMQAQLAESRRKLAEQERELAWREMAKQVAHEIKNPLTPMKLSVQHLRHIFRPPGEDDPPEARKFAGAFERTTEMLVEQIESLRHIASEFSDFARLPLRNPEALDLNEIAEDVASLFETEAMGETARATLQTDLHPEPLATVADREELRRAFVNLLTNAHQAMAHRDDQTRPGRIVLRTRHQTAPDGTQWAIAEVADTGMGVPPEARAKIFQPSFSTKSSGMGLGLAVVKRAVEAAGGSIGFETETEGQATGTTFTMRLPLAPEAGAGVAPLA